MDVLPSVLVEPVDERADLPVRVGEVRLIAVSSGHHAEEVVKPFLADAKTAEVWRATHANRLRLPKRLARAAVVLL